MKIIKNARGVRKMIKDPYYPDYEGELLTIEEDLLPDLKDQLNWLESPNYDPSQNDDHELREQDIEFLEGEIAELERRVVFLKAKLSRLNR